MNKTIKRFHILLEEALVKRLHEAKIKTGIPIAEYIRRAVDLALKADKL